MPSATHYPPPPDAPLRRVLRGDWLAADTLGNCSLTRMLMKFWPNCIKLPTTTTKCLGALFKRKLGRLLVPALVPLNLSSFSWYYYSGPFGSEIIIFHKRRIPTLALVLLLLLPLDYSCSLLPLSVLCVWVCFFFINFHSQSYALSTLPLPPPAPQNAHLDLFTHFT